MVNFTFRLCIFCSVSSFGLRRYSFSLKFSTCCISVRFNYLKKTPLNRGPYVKLKHAIFQTDLTDFYLRKT